MKKNFLFRLQNRRIFIKLNKRKDRQKEKKRIEFAVKIFGVVILTLKEKPDWNQGNFPPRFAVDDFSNGK